MVQASAGQGGDWCGEVAQWVKQGTCLQSLTLEFNLPDEDPRREPAPASFPSTHTHAPWHTVLYTHTSCAHKHFQI